jgi:NAD(P)-dependent dehydrogenase (short-subunit alcohol dehydrogenase family)
MLAYDDLVLGSPPSEVWERLASTTTIAENPLAGYSMSKRSVILLCQRLARRWGSRGARLVTVSPGVIATEMSRVAQGQAGNAVIDAASPPRSGAAAEIGSVIAFLCSPAAAYVHGADLLVDGGSVASLLTDPDLREARDAWVAASAFSPNLGAS